jgi:hypothetical protein
MTLAGADQSMIEAPPAKPKPLAGRLFTAAVRVALMVGLLLCGWLLLRTYRDLFSDLNGSSPPHEQTPDLAGGFVESLLQPGSWHFANTAWTLSRVEVDAAGVEAVFNRPAPARPEGAPDRQERDLLTWLRGASKPRDTDDGRLYDNNMGPVRLRAWVSGTGADERLRLARVGWLHHVDRGGMRIDEGRWIVFEVRPLGVAQQGEAHLIPPGTGAVSLARRWDAAGKLDAELIRPQRDVETFLTECRAQGWTTHPLLAPTEAGIGWRLSGPGGTLQAWPLPGGGPIEGWMLILREQGERKR